MRNKLLLVLVLCSMSALFAQADRREESKTRLQRDDMMGINEGAFYYTHLKRGIIKDERARWESQWLPLTTLVTYNEENKILVLSFEGEESITVKHLKIDHNISGDGYLYYQGRYKGLVQMVITPRELRVAFDKDGTAFKIFK